MTVSVAFIPPQFGDEYDGHKMRQLVAELERLHAEIVRTADTADEINDLSIAAVWPTATTAQLVDVGHAVNTSAVKATGSPVFNTTTSKPVWAVGNADASVWVDATGATVHTPA